MAKVFREEQRFHDRIAVGAIIAILALILYALLAPFLKGQIPFPFLSLTVFIVVTVSMVLLLKRLRMHFSISKKKIRIKLAPWIGRNFEITRDEVESIQFFKINEAIISSGLTVHFGDKTKNFYMGDRAGIVIRLKNGKNRVVFSDSLFLDRDRISGSLTECGWSVINEGDAVLHS